MKVGEQSLWNVAPICAPHQRRFGQPFNGLIIPFGSLVEYYPLVKCNMVFGRVTKRNLLSAVLGKTDVGHGNRIRRRNFDKRSPSPS